MRADPHSLPVFLCSLISIISVMMRNTKMWWLFITVIIYLTNLTMGDEPKIIIIGAGPSGIAAASKLYENGFKNVTILEAENRIGGRVYTTQFNGIQIDLGGAWVHGQTGNVVYELAAPLGLLEIPEETVFKFVIYTSEGSQIPTSINDNLIELYLNLDDRSAEELRGKNSSAGNYFTTRITTEAAKFPGVTPTLIRQFIKLSAGLQNTKDGSDNWFNTSGRGYAEYWNCDGNTGINWKDRGYGTILDILMKKYPNPEDELPVRNNTILNTEVSKIDYSTTEGKVLIESRNGEKYIADHVIVTPSIGVLKEQYETLFTPPLPEHKVKTIKGLTIGSVAKLYFSFEEEWWTNNATFFTFMWDESERQKYENDPDKKWLLDIVGFVTLVHKPRILMGWIAGEGVRYMETLPEDQVFNESFAILKKFLGNSYNIRRPTGFLRTTWHSNKHFRGTYTYRSLESDKADVWGHDLAAPLLVDNKPTVMFAGEATNDHHFSTVHGAIESGFREANRLIALYKNTTIRYTYAMEAFE